MPNIIVKVPKGSFDPTSRQALGKGVHAAAKVVEGWGDDLRQEALTWVLIEEIDTSNWYVGGVDQSSRLIPVIVFFYPPAGVIDAEGRKKATRLVHDAVISAVPSGEKRLVVTSIMIWDVMDGTWGANGQIWHLADFAKAGGYKHLQHLTGSV